MAFLTGTVDGHTQGQLGRQVPVERGDESPGVALLLEKPADSGSFTVLPCSEDHWLQHVHLPHGYNGKN